MARPRKPTIVKRLQGTLRKDRTNPHEPDPPDSDASPPRYLVGRALELWKEEAPIFITAGLLKRTHRAAFAEWMVVRARIEAGEKSPTLFRVSQAYETQFGATPSSQSRVHVAPEKPESKLERFIGGKAS